MTRRTMPADLSKGIAAATQEDLASGASNLPARSKMGIDGNIDGQ